MNDIKIMAFKFVTAMVVAIVIPGVISMFYTCKVSKNKNVKAEEQNHLIEDTNGNVYTSRIMFDGKHWTTKNLNINISDSYCYDDMESNCDKYGRLYKWEAAKNACEKLGEGWRLPTNDEWRKMAKQYGGVLDDSESNGEAAYKSLLDGGDSEFYALLGGNRNSDGSYARLEAHGFYWSATETNIESAWFYNFARGALLLNRHQDGEKEMACSVRCIREIEN